MADEGEEESTEHNTQPAEEEELSSNTLTLETAGECLSMLCKTGDGLAHAYANMDVKDRQLTDVSVLRTFIHVRYLDLSGNFLTDISAVGGLTHLLTIRADRNRLTSAHFQELPYLQSASFANNMITSTQGIAHPMLETLNLSGNKITDLEGLTQQNLPSLQYLDLHSNQLTSCSGIHLPLLEKLYLASNKLSKVEGLEALCKLTTLHMRQNQISVLDGFVPTMQSLQYINLRGNAVAELSEIKKLVSLPFLRALILTECPVTEVEDYRIEVLIALRKLERLDKDEFTEDERTDAEEVYKQRIADSADKS